MTPNETRRRRLVTGAWLVPAVVLILCGCASSDPRPKYATPGLASDQVATIKAGSGYWVDSVDGARLPGPGFFAFSGNTVKVAPGDRSIGLDIPGGYFQFSYHFRAGHSYTLSNPGPNSGVVKITDKQTGTSAVVGG